VGVGGEVGVGGGRLDTSSVLLAGLRFPERRTSPPPVIRSTVLGVGPKEDIEWLKAGLPYRGT